MKLCNKKIGVWGYGVVGKSATQFLHSAGATVDVLDKRELTSEEKNYLQKLQISWQQQNDIENWLENHDAIFASPGIDLRQYTKFQHTFITELDIFSKHFCKPILCVTGSTGKTSTTTILSELCKQKYPQLWTGGNIGTCMLDALCEKETDAALLELSSFQLENCTSFAPDVALWTNFYPNHLDRHGTLDAYFDAKYHAIEHQNKNQHAIVPIALFDKINDRNPHSTIHYTAQSKPEAATLRKINGCVFYYAENAIMVMQNGIERKLLPLNEIPAISFLENWIGICGLLHILNIPHSKITSIEEKIKLPEHRLEKCAVVNGVDFYNDSKATTSEATIAAVQQLKRYNRPIRIFIGGLGKGVNRTPLINTIKNLVATIYCFGNEHEQLAKKCAAEGAHFFHAPKLAEAYTLCTQHMQTGDIILFSPAGASFDEFKNYEERGNYFKNIVNDFTNDNRIR